MAQPSCVRPDPGAAPAAVGAPVGSDDGRSSDHSGASARRACRGRVSDTCHERPPASATVRDGRRTPSGDRSCWPTSAPSDAKILRPRIR